MGAHAEGGISTLDKKAGHDNVPEPCGRPMDDGGSLDEGESHVLRDPRRRIGPGFRSQSQKILVKASGLDRADAFRAQGPDTET